jgi:flagellin
MAIFGSGVSQAQLSLAAADQASAKLGQRLISGKKVESARDDSSIWVTADRVESAGSILSAVHTGLTEMVTNLGIVDTTMQTVGDDLDTAASQLRQAQGFALGDQSRAQYITNFNNVLQQIDSVVNTTQDTVARNLMTDPVANPQAGSVQVLVGPDGEMRTVHAQEIDTGPQGLNLGALNPLTATDADITAALQSLDIARATLASRRSALGIDTADIKRYQSQTSKISSLYQSAVESLTGADPTETALQLQSVQLQHSLALQTLASISSDRNAVLELLR